MVLRTMTCSRLGTFRLVFIAFSIVIIIGSVLVALLFTPTSFQKQPTRVLTLSVEILSSQKIALRWSLSPLGTSEGFIIERGTSPSAFAHLADVPATELQFIDTTVESGATYYYRVLLHDRTLLSNTMEVRVPSRQKEPTVPKEPLTQPPRPPRPPGPPQAPRNQSQPPTLVVPANAEDVYAPEVETFTFSGPAWQITFKDEGNGTVFTPSEELPVTLRTEGRRTTYTWENVTTPYGKIRVILEKEHLASTKIRTRLRAQLVTSSRLIQSVAFHLRLAPAANNDANNQMLMVPLFLGTQTTVNPYQRSEEHTSYYPVWQFPYVLLFNGRDLYGRGEGLSLRLEDEEGKVIFVTLKGTGTALQLSTGSKVYGGMDTVTTPHLVVERYAGAAYQGTLLYRTWVSEQPWVRPVPPVEENRMIPEKIKNSPFMVVFGNADSSYDPKFAAQFFTYYMNMTMGNDLTVLLLQYGAYGVAIPAYYETRMDGATDMIQEAKSRGIFTIAYQYLDVEPSSSLGIREQDMAVDCAGNRRSNFLEPHSPSMLVLERLLASQTDVNRWGGANAAIDMNYFDHVNPEQHDTCGSIVGVQRRDGNEAITGLQRFFERMAAAQPQHYGFATEVLIDRYLRWVPMSAAGDGDFCALAGPGAEFPHISYVYSDKSLRTAGAGTTSAADLHRGSVEGLFSMVVLGKMPFIPDYQDLPEKTFFSVQVLPSFERALRNYAMVFPVIKRFVRFGRLFPELENVNTLTVSGSSLGYSTNLCRAPRHPLVVHGVFQYQRGNAQEWGIVLFNWNDHQAALLPSVDATDRAILERSDVPFSGTFDPTRYDVQTDGQYTLYHYNKEQQQYEPITEIRGPVRVEANVLSLSSELFVVKKGGSNPSA